MLLLPPVRVAPRPRGDPRRRPLLRAAQRGLRASGALEPISPPWDEVFILVALVLCAMPSGQQLITMTELGGGDRAVLGTIIFLQYCLVPIALAATITAIVLMTAML